MSPYIKSNQRYSYGELENIFDKTDVLVVPSIWYETFGYTVLEALSYGVPVIISDTVGAKNILASGVGTIFESSNLDSLINAIKSLDSKKLALMNMNIIENQKILEIDEMSKNIITLLY